MAEVLTQKIYERGSDVPRIECREIVCLGVSSLICLFFPSLFPDLFSHPGTILSTSPQMLWSNDKRLILSLATGVEPERIAGDVKKI